LKSCYTSLLSAVVLPGRKYNAGILWEFKLDVVVGSLKCHAIIEAMLISGTTQYGLEFFVELRSSMFGDVSVVCHIQSLPSLAVILCWGVSSQQEKWYQPTPLLQLLPYGGMS